MRILTPAIAVLFNLSACAASRQATTQDLTAAYDVAAAAEAAYAASPSANDAQIARARALLSAAQAALLTWSNSSSAADQTAAAAAIAALVAYEANLGSPYAHVVSSTH